MNHVVYRINLIKFDYNLLTICSNLRIGNLQDVMFIWTKNHFILARISHCENQQNLQ